MEEDCKFAKSKPVSKIGLGNETGDVSKAGVVSINGVEEESNVGVAVVVGKVVNGIGVVFKENVSNDGVNPEETWV